MRQETLCKCVEPRNVSFRSPANVLDGERTNEQDPGQGAHTKTHIEFMFP